MPKMTHLLITALKDVTIITATKKLRYRKVENLEGQGMPEKQTDEYENQHGLSLKFDQQVEIDVTDAQLPAFQAAVDAGDIECVMTVQPVAATHQALTKSEPMTGPGPTRREMADRAAGKKE